MDTVRRRERALLAALKLPKQRRFEVEESLDELGIADDCLSVTRTHPAALHVWTDADASGRGCRHDVATRRCRAETQRNLNAKRKSLSLERLRGDNQTTQR